jgi:catechol 2,3-dioxygenase-like lactoylglutathione lyase family enzyme
MAVQLNHTIMWVHDPKASAEFLTSILGPPEATRFAHFLVVKLDNEVSLDSAEFGGGIARGAGSYSPR